MVIHVGGETICPYLVSPVFCPLSLSILRLQYFARGSQSYHAQLQAALKGKSVLDMKDEQVSW